MNSLVNFTVCLDPRMICQHVRKGQEKKDEKERIILVVYIKFYSSFSYKTFAKFWIFLYFIRSIKIWRLLYFSTFFLQRFTTETQKEHWKVFQVIHPQSQLVTILSTRSFTLWKSTKQERSVSFFFIFLLLFIIY